MKKIFKTISIQLSLFVLLISSFWIIYAAWNDSVSPWNPLTAESWNEIVDRVSVFNIDGWNIWIGLSSSYPLSVKWPNNNGNPAFYAQNPNRDIAATFEGRNNSAAFPNGLASINIVNNAAVTWRRSWVRLGLSWIPESVILSSITHEETTATWLPWVNGYGDFLIATRSSWGITEKIRVTNFWNVWIWTSTPWSKLSVVGLQSGTSLSDAGLDSTPIWAVCIAADGDIYVDTDGVCN